MNKLCTKALFLTVFLALFAGCEYFASLNDSSGSDDNGSESEETGGSENTGGAGNTDGSGNTGGPNDTTDADSGNTEGFAGTIVPIPAEPVAVDYAAFATKAVAKSTSSGTYPVDVAWSELDTGSQAAYLNQTDREALIWLNFMRTRPSLFANMMAYDNNSETTGIGVSDADRVNDYFPNWKLGTSKGLYLAARNMAVHFACSDAWDINKYSKLLTVQHYTADGTAGYFYVLDGSSLEAFISKLQTNVGKYAPIEGFQWHQRAEAGRGPTPAEANMAAVAVEGAICVVAFGKDIVDKDDLPDNIIAGNNGKIYNQYTGDTTFADLQDNPSFGIAGMDTSRIWDTGNYLKNKALEIVGDAADDKQKAERLLRWIIDEFEYDYTYTTSTQNACDILSRLLNQTDNRIVCAEYARIMTAFCRVLGIKARYVEGLSATTGASSWQGHAWVQVFFNGTWNMCDPTWNDTGGQSNTLIFFPAAINGDNKHFLRF